MNMILYDELGRITHTIEGEASNCAELLRTHDRLLIVDEFPNIDTHYVIYGSVIERPVIPMPESLNILANGEDSVVFTFPETMSVVVEGEIYETDTLTVMSNEPDVYDVSVDHWPYLPFFAQVIAT